MDANLFTNVLLMFSINFMGSDNGFMSFHQKENGTYLNVLIVGVMWDVLKAFIRGLA